MSKLDDLKKSYGNELDSAARRHSDQTEKEMRRLRRNQFQGYQPTKLGPSDLDLGDRSSKSQPGQWDSLQNQPLVRSLLIDLAKTDLRYVLDEAFSQAINLANYFPSYKLDCPTHICETTADYIAPQLELQNISEQERQRIIKSTQEQEYIHPSLGVYLQGLGAYINGAAIARIYDLPPTIDALENNPQARQEILSTLAHEKLGHGFLAAYSALGDVEEKIGKTQIEIANSFGLRASDDPTFRLREQQLQVLLGASMLLEEGWATWIETYLQRELGLDVQHPKHDIGEVIHKLRRFGKRIQRKEYKNVIQALKAIWGPIPMPLQGLHQAVGYLANCEEFLDVSFEEFFGQPLRYVVGNIILSRAEISLGPKCVPYAALIATNISLDPSAIGLIDMQILLTEDSRLNPNTRLAALSRLEMESPNDIEELVHRAEAELSFSVPKALKTHLN
jgi:hypothetical protein